MTAARNWQKGQSLFLEPMELLGHKVDRGGHCTAFSYLTEDFILRRKTEILNERLELMNNHSAKELVKKIRDAQEEQSKIAVNKRKLKENKPINDPIIDTPEKQAKRQEYLNILSVFEPIQFIQKFNDYRRYFENDDKLTSMNGPQKAYETVTSDELRRDKVISLPIITDIYTIKELTKKLNKLQESLTKPVPINYAVSMILKDGEHAITIGFDPKYENPWIFSDSNHLPIKFFKTEEIAKNIFDAFTNNSYCGFATRLSVKENHSQDLTNRLRYLRTGRIVTEEKADRISSNRATWLFLAAKFNDFEIVKQLVKIDPLPVNLGNYSPFTIACRLGHTESVAELLNSRFVSNKIEFDDTGLTLAIENNHPLIVRKLLQAGSKYLTLSNGASALYTAVSFGYADIVREILKIDLNINLPFKGTLPLAKATANKEIIIMRMLKKTEELGKDLAIQDLKSHFINEVRKEAIIATVKLLNIDFDEQGHIKYDDKIKVAFKKFDSLARGLTNIIENYHPKNKARQESLNKLETAIKNAYKAYSKNPNDVDNLTKELEQEATKLSEEANYSHQKEQNSLSSLFSTKSRLHTQIQAVLQKHSVANSSEFILKKSA